MSGKSGDGDGIEFKRCKYRDHRNKLIHSVAVFSDGGENQIVLKEWLKHKQRWHYWVESHFFVDYMVNNLKAWKEIKGK